MEVIMIRSIQRLAGISVLLIAPLASAFQQKAGPPASPSSSTLQGSYADGAGVPARQTRSRTASNGREVISETTETPGTDGRYRVSRETVTETVKTGTDSSQTKHEVFAPDAQGRRRLIETTQTDVQTSRDGSSRSVANKMEPDLNGRLVLSSQEIQDVKPLGPNAKQTDTTVFRPGINQPLVESERVQATERKVNANLTQNESTRFQRDGNGRWQAIETRNEEVRTSGNDRVAEETVQRLADNGTLSLSEKKVTKQTKSSGRDETVVETFSSTTGIYSRNSDRFQLNERVRTTVTPMAGGGQQTIREVEGRSRVAPDEPLRVMERIVETIRQTGPDRWEVERQVFYVDGNGRLTPVLTERGQASGK
jgi:hypothetical protein